MSWIKAVAEWNARNNNKTYCVPKKGSAEYDAVKRIMETMKTGKGKVAEKIKSVEEKKPVVKRKLIKKKSTE